MIIKAMMIVNERDSDSDDSDFWGAIYTGAQVVLDISDIIAAVEGEEGEDGDDKPVHEAVPTEAIGANRGQRYVQQGKVKRGETPVVWWPKPADAERTRTVEKRSRNVASCCDTGIDEDGFHEDHEDASKTIY